MARNWVAGAPPSPLRLAFRVALATVILALPARLAQGWELARVEARVDNLDELLCACEGRRAEAESRNRQVDAWLAYQASHGMDAAAGATRSPVPRCDAAAVTSRLASGTPAVWTMRAAADGTLLATVNLPVAGILVSSDAGRSWHYRHLFLPGFDLERPTLLRGMDYRHGLLAVASEGGILLSTDAGYTFDTALGGRPFSAVAVSPVSSDLIVAGGNGTSVLSRDGGKSWSELGFSRFATSLARRNPFATDHITSLEFDPLDPRTIYVGTGSLLYRYVIAAPSSPTADGAADGPTVAAATDPPGRWQVMQGAAGDRVIGDSTVYNIAIGSRFMISTCNGVYTLERMGADSGLPEADVSWRKLRDPAFSQRDVGGPRGNLRAYFVAEDPSDPSRVLIADFAGLYEGRSDGRGLRFRRVAGLPYYVPGMGYPEYTAIAWARTGETVVGSRYRGIFFEQPPAATPAVAAAVAAGPVPVHVTPALLAPSPPAVIAPASPSPGVPGGTGGTSHRGDTGRS